MDSGHMLAFWLGFISLVIIKTQKHQQGGQQMLLGGGVLVGLSISFLRGDVLNVDAAGKG